MNGRLYPWISLVATLSCLTTGTGGGQDLSAVLGSSGSTAILVFHVAEEATHAWVITEGGVQTTYRIAISRDELRERVDAFMDLIMATPRTGEEMVQYLRVLEQGRDLYDMLLAPGENWREGARHVAVVPSDALWRLPFAALYRCPGCEGRDLLSGRFWVEERSISLAPSLGAALGMLRQQAEGRYGSVLAIAPDEMLPHSQDEARTVASMFPESTVLQGVAATEANVKQLLGETRYDVIHFTGPSLRLDGTDPLRSGIGLLEGEGEDGVLRVSEVLDLGLRAGLLVLSGCISEETSAPDDVLPLVLDALTAPGIASLVFALGSVTDLSAAVLVTEMYHGLLGGLSRGEALRRAQLKLAQDESGIFRHPRHWALFVLYGEWRGMTMSQMPGTEKLDYTLARLLTEWKGRVHPPDETPPVVSVLVTLERPATSADLEAFRSLSSELELVGSFGAFVQVRIPLPLLEALVALPQVRSISAPPETIHN